MKLTNNEIIELRGKILKGITIAFEKLIETKKKTNSEFAFSKDGQIYFIKAKDPIGEASELFLFMKS